MAGKKAAETKDVTFKQAVQQFKTKVQDHIDQIASHRDAIRELIQEYEAICENADEAIDHLTDGMDKIAHNL